MKTPRRQRPAGAQIGDLWASAWFALVLSTFIGVYVGRVVALVAAVVLGIFFFVVIERGQR